ncbi:MULTISPECIES: hypothetical protein [unclassified Microcoleus]
MGQMKMRRSPLCFTPAIDNRGGATTRSRDPPPLWRYRHSDCRRLYRQ